MGKNLNLRSEFLKGQKDFIAGLEKKIEQLGTYFEDFSKEDIKKGIVTLPDIVKRVQELKQNAATYELSFISSVCSNIEDFLMKINEKKEGEKVDIAFVNNLLALLKSYISNLEKEEFLHEELDDLVKADEHRILIVEKEERLIEHYKQVFNELGIKYSIVHSGQEAFFRLLKEKFDSLITSVPTGVIDGVSLIALTKVVKSPNINIKTILIAPESYSILPLHSVPYRIIYRDENLLEELKTVYAGLMSFGRAHSKNEHIFTQHHVWKILAVDDDDEVFNLLKLGAKTNKTVDLKCVHNAEEMMKSMKNERPDILLLDVFLEKESGVDILANLRKDEEYYDLPVIFLTARREDQEGRSLVQTDALGVISKPFDPHKIFKEIQDLYKMYYL